MTITAGITEISYAGDNASTVFPVPFPFHDETDLLIVLTAPDGSTQTLTSGFTVTGGDGETGDVTLDAPLASGYTLTIADNPELSQQVDYISNDAFPAETHEFALDKLTRIAKRLVRQVGRAARTQDGDAPIDPLPPMARRADQFFMFDSSGHPTVSELSVGSRAGRMFAFDQLGRPTTIPVAVPGPGLAPGAFINVKDFGAKGDGVSDDSDSLQAAIDFAKVSGVPLSLNSKVIKISKAVTIDAPVAIQDGTIVAGSAFSGTAVINAADASLVQLRNVLVSGADNTNLWAFNFERCSDVEMSEVTLMDFKSNSGDSNIAVFDKCENVRIRGIRVYRSDTRDGIRFQDSVRCHVHEVVADEIAGRLMSGAGSDDIHWSNIRIRGARGFGDFGIGYAGEILYMNKCTNYSITDVFFKEITSQCQAVKLSRGCEDGVISDVTVAKATDYRNAGVFRFEGVRRLDAARLRIYEATPYSGSLGGLISILPHRDVEEESEDVHIRECTLYGDARGIQIDGDEDLPTKRIRLTDNTVYVTTNAIRFAGRVDDLIMSGGIYTSDERVVSPLSTGALCPRLLLMNGVTFVMLGVDNRVIHVNGDPDNDGTWIFSMLGCTVYAPGATGNSIRFEGAFDSAAIQGCFLLPNTISDGGNSVDADNYTFSS